MNDDSEDREADLQSVLDALDDRDCRTILRALDTPMSAQELMTECELSQTTTYRKLKLLQKADLLDEETGLRDDGHHTTRYKRDVAGIAIGLTGKDSFNVTMIRSPESADKRLTTFWESISDEL